MPLLLDQEQAGVAMAAFGIDPGLQLPTGPWENRVLIDTGISPPGTLKQVLRRYTGNRNSRQQITDDELIQAPLLPHLWVGLFRRAGGTGFESPFDVATIRLSNMGECLGHSARTVPATIASCSGKGRSCSGWMKRCWLDIAIGQSLDSRKQ